MYESENVKNNLKSIFKNTLNHEIIDFIAKNKEGCKVLESILDHIEKENKQCQN